MKILFSALAIAAVSTFGDFIWAGLHLRHRPLYGLSHGTLLFLSIGFVLGAMEKRAPLGAAAGAAIGFAAAASFYLLFPLVGYPAMFVVWTLVWFGLAFLAGRVLRQSDPLPFSNVVARGVAAAIGSGIAFYLISGIWRPFNPRGWDYAVHFLSWTIAYLPGFAALALQPKQYNVPS